MNGDRLWTARYSVGVAAMFGTYLISSILLSTLTVYAKKLTGLDSSAGLMTSLFTIGALAVRFLAGGIVDRLGGRKVIVGGIAILMLGSVALLTCRRIEYAYAARLIQGLGFGIATTAAGTYIAAVCPPSQLLEGLGYAAIAQSVSAVLGPSVGFFIIGPAYDHFVPLFIATIVIGALTAGVMLPIRESSARAGLGGDAHRESRDGRTAAAGGIPTSLYLPILIVFLNALAQSSIVAFLALYAISLSFTGIGAFFAINAAGMIASRLVMNRVVGRIGEFPAIIANLIVSGLSIFSLTRVTTMFQFMLPAFPTGFATGSTAPIINAIIIRGLPENRKGFANALYFSGLDLGYAVGAIGWSFVAERAGYGSVFLAAALVQVFGLVLAMIRSRSARRA